MLDFLVFLLDIPSLLADFSPRAKHKGESPYWRFMGLFLGPYILDFGSSICY